MITFPIRLEITRQAEDGSVETHRFKLLEAGIYGIGREVDPENDIVIPAPDVSRRHAYLIVGPDGIEVLDRNSTYGTFIGKERVDRATWHPDQPLWIARYRCGYEIPKPKAEPRPSPSPEPAPSPAPRVEEQLAPAWVVSDEGTELFAQSQGQKRLDVSTRFPGDLFAQPVVAMSAIRSSGQPYAECEYLALGGGLGSFIWVDHLRCFGVNAGSIRVLGEVGRNTADPADFPRPYYSYRTLCTNSQIPDHERLRSNAISTPDNIWGFPGYASRETWRDLKSGRFSGLKYVFQVFGEPAFSESYTPKSGDVYRSIDREAMRIGWASMCVQGQIIKMRKTDDGRYAVAYKLAREVAGNAPRNQFLVARHVHVATGYPAYRTEDDIFRFNQRHGAKRRVVKAYDSHDHIYFDLEHSQAPMDVVVRGRGIVASRILQRLYEARARNPRIRVFHQMRTALADDQGSRFGRARRQVFNHTELQPFNWPKACWGGDLRREIEEASPERRSQIYAALGGTTTADRRDWKNIIIKGHAEGWYRVVIGALNIENLVSDQGRDKVLMAYRGPDTSMPAKTVVDYVIDCIGLVGSIDNSAFLSDLVTTYALPRNRDHTKQDKPALGIAVTPDFEIDGLRQPAGRVYAAGQITGHGPYAAVDSFLGLQYAALRSVDHLHASRAPGVSSFGALRSFGQWLRWCRNAPP